MRNRQQDERLKNICREISNERLESIKNSHRGKRCFILGNGPSLNKVELSRLKDEITFGMNRVYTDFATMGFVPTYYICVDDLLLRQFGNDINKIESIKFHDIEQFGPDVSSANTIYIEKNLSKDKFFTDLQEGYNPGDSAAFVAMQLAYHMGFSQICLVGFDHDMPDKKMIEDSFQMAKGDCEWNGRIIIDATPGGQLTVFPKVDFAEIFRSPQSTPSPESKICKNNEQLPASGIQHEYVVSAIVSTYNSERFIRECLDDLLRQTIADRMEIIVVNSCSQQNEEAIVFEYMSQHPNIVYLKTPTRETIYKAWNRAIRIARGKYITNANTDDGHAPDAYEKMARVLDEHTDVGLVYVDQKYYREVEGGRREFWFDCDRGPFSWNRLLDDCFASSQPMWRACVHDEFGYFDEIFFTAGDYEYWLRIAQKYKLYHLKELLGVRLIRGDSLEYEGNSYLSFLETAYLQKCYDYAALYAIPVGPEGLGRHPIFSRWCEISMLRRNTLQKIGADDKSNTRLYDWRLNKQPPLVSVIITTYNRKKELLENLSILADQSFTDFEVVVVNNGQSIDELREFTAKLPFGCCYVESSANYGPSFARNLGVRSAKGSIVAILDDDAIADKEWLYNIVSHFRTEDIIALRGRVLLRTPGENKHIPLNYDLGANTVISTVGLEMNTAFRKEAFLAVGGYDEFLFGFEGAELSYRLFCNYGKRIDCIKYYPDVLIYHDFPEKTDRLTETVLRLKAMRKTLQKKSPGFESYVGFMWRMMPFNQKWGDAAWLSDNAVFCLDCNPIKADEFADAAMKIVPYEPVPYVVRGQALGMLSRFEEAIPMFSKAVELLAEYQAQCCRAGNESPPGFQHLLTVAETGLRGCKESVEIHSSQTSKAHQAGHETERRTVILRSSADRMRQYQDIHAGQRCVIIGNGPSLNKMDLSFLENEICFGMNRIFLIYDKWRFRPSYYVSVNPLVIEQSTKEISSLPMPRFLSHKGIEFFEEPGDIMFIAEHPEWEFSATPYSGLHEGWTVTFVAMQLAYFMGFSEVVLIGVDHHFVTPGDPNKEVVSQGDDPNHFHPDYFGKGMRWHLPDLERSEHSYHLAKSAFESTDRIIVDATYDGKLTVFPKVDYREYFSASPKVKLAALAELFSKHPSRSSGELLTNLLRSLGYHNDAELVVKACQSL